MNRIQSVSIFEHVLSHCSQSLVAYRLVFTVKGVVHFKKKKTFADNLPTPMSSKMSMSFYLQSKRNKVFDENLPGFSGLHWEPNGPRSK